MRCDKNRNIVRIKRFEYIGQIVCQILTYAEIGTDISSGDTLFGIYATPTKYDNVAWFW